LLLWGQDGSFCHLVDYRRHVLTSPHSKPWGCYCNRIPPKELQNVAADLRGVETLAGSLSPPQRSLVSQL
jgi:hypothetical protein